MAGRPKKSTRDIDPTTQGEEAPKEFPSLPVSEVKVERPDIFRYHQYQEYLKDWLNYQKHLSKKFSLRKLAREQSLAVGYLPMILANKRPLSFIGLRKIMPALGLNRSEQQFLEIIHLLGTTSSQEVRMDCLRKMKSFAKFRSLNKKETEISVYLSHWYYAVIRELSAFKDFKLDPVWIQDQLRLSVPLQEVKEAITFLIENQYLLVNESGVVIPPDKHLVCEGGIYRVALGQYHREFLNLATKSIENSDSSERYLLGHTFSISSEKYDLARQLVDDVVAKIQALCDNTPNESEDAVYHLEMALFPLTKKRIGSEV